MEFYIGETWRSNSSGEDLQRLILVADNMEEKEEWLKVMEKDFRFLSLGSFLLGAGEGGEQQHLHRRPPACRGDKEERIGWSRGGALRPWGADCADL